MAEEKKDETHPLEPVVVLFVILFIFNLLMGVINRVSERFGISFTNIERILSGEPLILPLGSNLKVGDEVVVGSETSVYANPGDDTPVSSVPAGTVGEIIEGPVNINGEDWWKVRFEDGTIGWVKGEDLIGTDVITKNETEVYANPGDPESVFSVPKGTVGKIVGGPVLINGEVWWEVEFEDGRRGWVKEDDLGAIGEPFLVGTFGSIISKLKVFSVFASLILLTLAIYSFIRLKSVQLETNKKFSDHYEPPEGFVIENKSWKRIIDLTNSQNPNDWKQSVIEADVILNGVLGNEGYMGDGIGDRLKGVDPANLTTLDSAWEAHKVRNKIAHGGGDFVLTQREAKRVVNLYEVVLKELNYF